MKKLLLGKICLIFLSIALMQCSKSDTEIATPDPEGDDAIVDSLLNN